MKYHYLPLICVGLTIQIKAQVPAPPPVIVEETVQVIPPSGADVHEVQRRMDAALARERLGIAPIVLPAQPVAPGVVETTTTTTTVDTPGKPLRVYSTEKNVVIVEGRELPYLTLPVLFVEGTDKLLDEESRLAIEDTAVAIKEVLVANPTAVFDVEGHTSTDGADDMNMKLSADRARRIYTELIKHYGLPTSALAAHGYGENYPNFPEGTEEQMVKDRRVLVVRVR